MADGSGVGIVALAACVPRDVRDNSWWPVDWLQTRTRDPARLDEAVPEDLPPQVREWLVDPFQGARLRRVIDERHQSSDLEVAAARAALAQVDDDVDKVGMLLGYSQVSDDAGPGNHGLVARGLGLSHELLALTVEAGCASFVPHLALASRLVTDGWALLYQSSATSRITDYRSAASVLVGDGAVAQVVGAVEPGLGFVDALHYTRGDLRDGLLLGRADGGGRWYEGGATPLVVTSRDPRQAVQMGALGPRYCREVCGALLERNGLVPQDVDFFVCAQAGAWFAPACAAALEIPESRAASPGGSDDRWVPPRDHFQRYGHLLAASAPLNLWVAWTTGRLRKGDLVLVYSPGVGFTQAALLMRWALNPPSASLADPVAP